MPTAVSTGKLKYATHYSDVSDPELVFHWVPRRTLILAEVNVKEGTCEKQTQTENQNGFEEESKS